MSRTTRTRKAPTRKPQEQQVTTIVCDESLDIAMARAWSTTLQQALAAQRPIVFAAEQVERVDTAALQLLCAWFQDARASGLDVQWRKPSEALCAAARLVDLDTCLALQRLSEVERMSEVGE